MIISMRRTEYLFVRAEDDGGAVSLQCVEVAKVDEFIYLRSTVLSNGECGREVICDTKVSVRMKGKICETVVRPAILYGMKKVPMKKKKRRQAEMEVAQLRMFRFSLLY